MVRSPHPSSFVPLAPVRILSHLRSAHLRPRLPLRRPQQQQQRQQLSLLPQQQRLSSVPLSRATPRASVSTMPARGSRGDGDDGFDGARTSTTSDSEACCRGSTTSEQRQLQQQQLTATPGKGRVLPPMPPFPLPPLPAAAPALYSVAPMMDVTDRHQRALARLISRHATLYTEMVVDRTLIHNEVLRSLELYVPPGQHPVVLQLGGSDPTLLGAAAALAARHPYVELNLNCGCPSPKVAGNGLFGAALMRDPALVAACCRAMRAGSGGKLPITVKCRLGLDDDTSFESLRNFIDVVATEGGVAHFIVHARNAILGGLSPAQNRSIPPLRYDDVYRLVAEFPHLRFSINGGVKTVAHVNEHLARGVAGVMVGRGVMDAPWRALRDVDAAVYAPRGYGARARPAGDGGEEREGEAEAEAEAGVSRREVLQQYIEYARREVETSGAGIRALVKPLLNLFVGEKNGKMFRRTVDEALRDGVSEIGELIERAVAVVPDFVLDDRSDAENNRSQESGKQPNAVAMRQEAAVQAGVTGATPLVRSSSQRSCGTGVDTGAVGGQGARFTATTSPTD